MMMFFFCFVLLVAMLTVGFSLGYDYGVQCTEERWSDAVKAAGHK